MILYQQVLTYDSTQVEPHKQLGAHYVNQAVHLHNGLDKAKGEQERQKTENSINQLLQNALPHFQFLNKAEPENTLWLEQLVMIGQYLELEGWQAYQTELEKLNE